jgi:hypothetical protein
MLATFEPAHKLWPPRSIIHLDESTELFIGEVLSIQLPGLVQNE